MANTIILPCFFDAHVHLRNGPMMQHVLRYTMRHARYALVMPNIKPRAVLNVDDVIRYRDEIRRARDAINADSRFEPLMSIEIRDNTTPQMIRDARLAGAVAGKVYPIGVTTNSENGLRDLWSAAMQDTLSAMHDEGMLLLLHGEYDRENLDVLYREREFLPDLIRLAEKQSDLKIVLEHVSSRKGVETVSELGPNVAATITLHHLMLTQNDVIGNGIRPHHGCNPMPKLFDDRDALVHAFTSESPKFFLGSDSAPHLQINKECAVGACGVFSAPVLAQCLAMLFADNKYRTEFRNFVSRFGTDFYGLPPIEETFELVEEETFVPEKIEGIVPFLAGKELAYRYA